MGSGCPLCHVLHIPTLFQWGGDSAECSELVVLIREADGLYANYKKLRLVPK